MVFKGLIVLHVFAIVAASLNALAISYKLIIIGLILISFLYHLKSQIDFSGFTIRHSEAFDWEIALIEHEFQQIEILKSTVITPYVIFLHFKLPKKQKQTAVICADALEGGEFRKLLVELKIAGIKTAQIQKMK